MFALFVAATGALYGALPLVHRCLRRCNSKFSDYDAGRQRYVEKNVLKSVVLAALCPYGTWIALNAFAGQWSNGAIRVGGAVYASTDALGLLVIPNLPTTTLAHHAIVMLVFLTSLTTDFENPTIMRGFVAYTFFSTLAFPVNAHLGLRFVIDDPHRRRQLAFVVACVYFASLWCNWACQLQIAASFPLYVSFPYVILLAPIVNDDVVLLRHLVRLSRFHKINN